MFDDLLKVSSNILVCSMLELFNSYIKNNTICSLFALHRIPEAEQLFLCLKLEAPEEENWES